MSRLPNLPPSPYDPAEVDAAAERAMQWAQSTRTRVEQDALRAIQDQRVNAEMDRLDSQGEIRAAGHLMFSNLHARQGRLSPDERFAQARWAAENVYSKYPSIGSQQMTQLLLSILDQLEGGPAPDPNAANLAMRKAIRDDVLVEVPRRVLNARQLEQGGELLPQEQEFDDARRQQAIDDARRQAQRPPEGP